MALPAVNVAKDRMLAFAFAGADMLIEIDGGGQIVYAVGAFRTRLGAPPEAYIGSSIAGIFHAGDHGALAVALAVGSARGRFPPMVVRLADTNSTESSLSGMARPDDPSRLCLSIGPIPTPAPLCTATGTDFLDQAVQRLRGGERPSVALLEVNGWKDVATMLSGPEQAQLLGDLSDALIAVGGSSGWLADGRFGVLSPRMIDMSGIARRLEEVLGRALGGRPPSVKGTAIDTTPESGIAEELTGAQLVASVRFAMLQFAEGGLQGLARVGFEGGLEGFVSRADQHARALRGALTHRRFRLAFQPVVTLADRRAHHYEALIRPHETELLPHATPQAFVSFAEAIGMAEDLDRAVLAEAGSMLAAYPASSIACNISGASVVIDGFIAFVLDLAGGARAGRLLLELTETAEVRDPVLAASHLLDLRRAGVPICIDDFGAGAAGLRYLRDFRPDYVKIDGSYVRRAPDSERDCSIIRSIVELSGSVGAEVIAEMVETEEVARLMGSLGIGFGQGYLFGKPGRIGA